MFGGRGTIVGVVLAVAVLGCLQTAMTADLIPAQDQNIVVGGLLLASVIVPNLGDIYRRTRARLRTAAARRQAAVSMRREAGGAATHTRGSRCSASGSRRTGRSSTACRSGSRAISAGSSDASRRWGPM